MPEFIARHMPIVKLLIRFVFSGGTATVVNLALLYFFTDIVGIWYLASSALSFCVAFLVSFTLQKWWTFKDRNTDVMRKQLGVYFTVAIVNLGLNMLFMYLFTDILGLWYLLSQALSSALIAVESFVVYKAFIFKVGIQAVRAEEAPAYTDEH